MSKAGTEPNLSTLPNSKSSVNTHFLWTGYKRHINHLQSDHLKHQERATRIITDTITVQERAANVINSTTLGPVELEPIVCVCDKIKDIINTDMILTPH